MMAPAVSEDGRKLLFVGGINHEYMLSDSDDSWIFANQCQVKVVDLTTKAITELSGHS